MQRVFLLFISVLSFTKIFSQDNSNISSIKVEYRMPAINQDVSTVKAYSEITLDFISLANVEKINIRIIDGTNQSNLFNLGYQLSSSKITSEDGLVLFERDGNKVFVSSPNPMPITPYRYEIETEDQNQNVSLIFSEIK